VRREILMTWTGFFLSTFLSVTGLGGSCKLFAAERIADKNLLDFVDQRVRDWQPTEAERRFDEIGWVKDIREALQLGKEHNRPVFLFTHDGRMAIGRC